MPPSAETSTPATTPPPASVAVPLMVTAEPSEKVAPDDGDVIVDVGGVVSVDCVAGASPDISVAGCTLPMSANRFTVACCMAGSVSRGPDPDPLSSPHAHCTVPAPNTRAPLDARYKVRWWVTVAVLPAVVMLP